MEPPVTTPFVSRSRALLGETATGRNPPVLLQTGFRPFFLLAGVSGVLLVPTLVGLLAAGGGESLPLPLFTWHGHELLFGFTGAVLAGFLLTAPQAWTGGITAKGASLAGLIALYLAARLGSVLPLVLPLSIRPELAAACNVPFFFVLSFFVARPIVRAKSWRNLGFPFLLLGLGIAQCALWAAALGLLDWGWVARAEWVALDLIVLTIALIGGRIIPMFSKSRLPGLEPRVHGGLDRFAVLSLLALLFAHAGGLGGRGLDGLLGVAGLAQLLRLRGWGMIRAVREAPFLGVLHLGYAALGLGLVATAIEPAAGRHLLTVGGVGLVSLAMMARVSLGHTGRPLEPPRVIGAALVLMGVAAGLRAAWPLCSPELAPFALYGGAAAWTLALAGFLVGLGPALVRPRVDGKLG